jgi:hypothetical protein
MRKRVLTLAALAVIALVATGFALGTAIKKHIPRDDVYYEINNDVGDHGNYIETYHVPNGRGGTVYCVVYSDKIGDGGGAGMSCDWAHS